MFAFHALPPLSLYIHWPWCVRKCPYCDFNSHEPRADGIPEAAYLDALLADLERELPAVWGRPLHSVFIGGGTPSLITPDGLERLLSALRARLALHPHVEVTLEANPGTVDQGRFAAYRQAGVNRLSIGVQSFDDRLLARIGRIHGRREALAAVEAARAAGFANLNLDLMFGLPGQDRAGALADLDAALAFAPEHLSWYQLTLEPNTAFHHAPPPLPDDDRLWDMQQAGGERLGAAGFERYEVSAWARAGRRCAHNLNYWQFGDYLGIGAGAHGKVTHPHPPGIERHAKRRSPADYLKGGAGAERRALTPDDAAFEFMLNALRLSDGFDPALFPRHTGLPLERIAEALLRAEARGLLERSPQRIRPTERGRTYLNDLLEGFLP